MTAVNRIELQRSHVQHTIAAYGGCRLTQHGRNTTSTDEYAVHGRQKKDICLLSRLECIAAAAEIGG